MIVLLSLAFYLTGCATLFKGDSSTIGLNSNPNGAVVLANGAEVCSATPCQVKLKSGKDWQLTFKKVGYAEKTVQVSGKIGILWLILDLFGFVPLVVDAVTGAWNELEPDNVIVTLDPKQ
jgi:hypothetical protein